jgi:uncharacterized protein with ParB-like and HNH nuclease domain
VSKKITGAEYPLGKIFSSDFEYVIPPYQRPYAWNTEQAVELFDDLYDFYQNEKEESYFLGSIVLIKDENIPYSEVIDGQQRLTTLTILLAVLTDFFDGEDRSDFFSYILEPGRRSQGIESKPRLTLRERDKQFFSDYVQSLKFDELFALNEGQLGNESQLNIKQNAALLKSKIIEKFKDDTESLLNFGLFLSTRCFLVVVSTPSQKSAFRVFSVLNNRGMDLLPSDIIKAEAIGQLPDDKRELFNDRWEEIEVETGRSGLNDLLSYIRMIYAKTKAKRALLDEFDEHVLSNVNSTESFIDTVITPFADAYLIARDCNYESSDNAGEINQLLAWLNRIDNSDWLPVAISYLAKFGSDRDAVLDFITKLERLAAQMHICASNINQRIERYAQVLTEIDVTELPDVAAVNLSQTEILLFQSVLNGQIYELTARRRNYLILRLDSFLTDGGASYNHRILTIEHVLPQTVSETSQWIDTWPDEEQRALWVHKIGNLVPLTQRRNSMASNFDFDKKKSAYFTGRSGVSSFILTTQVLKENEWTPEVVARRQEDLLSVCNTSWNLGNIT